MLERRFCRPELLSQKPEWRRGLILQWGAPASASTAGMEVLKVLIHSIASDRAKAPGSCHWMTISVQYPSDSVLSREFRGVYDLPRSGLVGQQRLVAHLVNSGYNRHPQIACLFRHADRGTIVMLAGDELGVKYKATDDAQHLIDTMSSLHEVHVDWTGSQFVGFTIEFDDIEACAVLSMPDVVPRLLERFHPDGLPDGKGVNTPALYALKYTKQWRRDDVDDSRLLDDSSAQRLQDIIDAFLFYGNAVDYCMLAAVNTIASKRTRPSEHLLQAAERLLHYAAKYPQQKLVYRACDMVLHIWSATKHTNGLPARVGGLHYLTDANRTLINGGILAISSMMPTVPSGTTEADYASACINAQHGVWLRTVLAALGYEQPATILRCSNQGTVDIANEVFKDRKNKAFDARYNWIRIRIRQGHFDVQWAKGEDNIAMALTKTLPVQKYKQHVPVLVKSTMDPAFVTATAGGRRKNWRSHGHHLVESVINMVGLDEQSENEDEEEEELCG